jgi:ABC-type branched-subunit amino acid transport system substrate-binding protein
MAKTTVRRVGALVVGLSLFAYACGSDSGSSSDTTGAPATEAPATEAPATEAPATEAPATEAPSGTAGALAGLKGTTPLTELSQAFKDKLLAIDPTLKDFNYGAETYDTVTIMALAAELAKTDGIDYAKEINGITRDGEKCTDFATCKAIIAAGGNPDYDGASGPLTFAGNGEPLEATYGLLVFGDDNRIDDSLTTYHPATASPDADVPQVPVEGTRVGDGKFVLGTILPQTGSLAFLGPPEFAAFDLAVQEINAAGGVLGQPMEGIKGDSGDATTDTANQTVDRLLSQNVDGIVGAASSGVSLTVIDKITGAGVVEFSPANTSTKLSDYPDKGLYFRAAPSDVLQGGTIGGIIAEDGNATVGAIVRNDAYGTSLLAEAKKALADAGVQVVVEKIYDEKAQTFDAEVDEIKAADPDAILIIGFEEASRILTAMVEKGIGPKDKPVYGVDGFVGNALGETFDAGK